jgi:hypothetical protein
MPEAMNPPLELKPEFSCDVSILYPATVEKNHFDRILCGISAFGTRKVHKTCTNERLTEENASGNGLRSDFEAGTNIMG